MARIALPVLLIAASFLAGCSSTPAICKALDDGQPALIAARTAYGDAHNDKAVAQRMLRQGSKEVRESCPNHTQQADQMDSMANLVVMAP